MIVDLVVCWVYLISCSLKCEITEADSWQRLIVVTCLLVFGGTVSSALFSACDRVVYISTCVISSFACQLHCLLNIGLRQWAVSTAWSFGRLFSKQKQQPSSRHRHSNMIVLNSDEMKTVLSRRFFLGAYLKMIWGLCFFFSWYSTIKTNPVWYTFPSIVSPSVNFYCPLLSTLLYRQYF